MKSKEALCCDYCTSSLLYTKVGTDFAAALERQCSVRIHKSMCASYQFFLVQLLQISIAFDIPRAPPMQSDTSTFKKKKNTTLVIQKLNQTVQTLEMQMSISRRRAEALIRVYRSRNHTFRGHLNIQRSMRTRELCNVEVLYKLQQNDNRSLS